MAFERRTIEGIKCADRYRVKSENECKIRVNREIIEEANELKHFRSIPCSCGSVEREIRDRER